MFAFLRRKKKRDQAAIKLYEAVVKQSHQPVFYEQYGVPDTETGRFDLICLHGFLVMDRLYEEGEEGKKLAQALFDGMFRDMDRNLREMGVGDLSIPKHMKRMMKGFNGRAISYKKAMEADDSSAFSEVLQRNLYGSDANVQEGGTKVMMLYMIETRAHLKEQSWGRLMQGPIEFKAMNYEENENHGKDKTGMVA